MTVMIDPHFAMIIDFSALPHRAAPDATGHTNDDSLVKNGILIQWLNIQAVALSTLARMSRGGIRVKPGHP